MRGRKGRHGAAKRSLEGADRESRRAVTLARRPEVLELQHFWEGDAVRLADRPGSSGDAARYVVARSHETPTHSSGKTGISVRPATGGPVVVALADHLYHVERCERCRRSWTLARAEIPKDDGRGALHWVDGGSLLRRTPRLRPLVQP